MIALDESDSAVSAPRIVIVRHAESAANAGAVTPDMASVPITEAGLRQAERLAESILVEPSVIVISRYCRTAQTAAPLINRYPLTPVECWEVQELTHLHPEACANTSFEQRKELRDAYWGRCDPHWVDGPGCESFAGFIDRVRAFENALSLRTPGELIVAFTHGVFMQALLWIQSEPRREVTPRAMRRFDEFRHKVIVPNCGIVRGIAADARLQFVLDEGPAT
jgi:broad specificity phosphatase PhoE